MSNTKEDDTTKTMTLEEYEQETIKNLILYGHSNIDPSMYK